MNATREQATSTPVPQLREQSKGRGFGLDKVVLVLVVIYFLVPLASTLVFALSAGNTFSLQGFSGN